MVPVIKQKLANQDGLGSISYLKGRTSGKWRFKKNCCCCCSYCCCSYCCCHYYCYYCCCYCCCYYSSCIL